MQRVDLFSTVHKALRAVIYHLSTMLQTTDFGDEKIANETLANLEHFFELLHEHAAYEDTTIFAAMRRFDNEMVDKLEGEHKAIPGLSAAVEADIAKVRGAKTPEERIAAGDALNRSVNDFIAFYLTHLMHEERSILPASWKYFTDEELVGMRIEVQKRATPQRYGEWMRWMFPAMNVNELTDMFRGLRAHAPAPVYDAMSQIAAVSLGEVRWQAVKQRAGLDAAGQPA